MEKIKKYSLNLENEELSSLSIELALEKFRSFMKTNFSSLNDFPSYDYAIGFTRYFNSFSQCFIIIIIFFILHRKPTFDLVIDEMGNLKLFKNAAYSFQKLAFKNNTFKNDEKQNMAVCNDNGYSLIGLTGSLKMVIIGAYELIQG